MLNKPWKFSELRSQSKKATDRRARTAISREFQKSLFRSTPQFLHERTGLLSSQHRKKMKKAPSLEDRLAESSHPVLTLNPLVLNLPISQRFG